MKVRFIIFLILSATITHIYSQETYGCQFKNMGFEDWENWDGSKNKFEPLYWHSFKSGVGALSAFTPNAVSRAEIARPGSDGRYSAKVVTKKVFGVKANGTLVNGRMNAGSVSLESSGNYFFTDRKNSEFNTPIIVTPDSITVWFCFRSLSKTDSAFVHCSIHGNDDCRLVSDGTYHPANLLVAKGDGFTTATCAPNSDNYSWKRMSVPFVIDKECVHNCPEYILASFSTNQYAGRGDESDELYIDDVLLIYNPTVKIEEITTQSNKLSDYSQNIPIEISYSLTGTMSPYNLNKGKNNVIVELSDANGSFSNPTNIGSIKSDTSGTIKCLIPIDKITPYKNYSIRIRTTNYPLVSETSQTKLIFQ